MSPEETAKMREKETDGMKKFRQAMSLEETPKRREKKTDGKRRFRQAMSPEEKAKINKKETKKRKQLTIEKMMLLDITANGLNSLRRRRVQKTMTMMFL